ncbi:MAG TPA: sugar transferase [Candidatus Tectomicrobia bacterium]|nr:sugar transferase [Candidatus Tectomicrobia bacterium]
MDRSQPSSTAFSPPYTAEGRSIPSPEVQEPLLKRPFDALLSGLGLLLSAPLWGLIALLIKLEDGGPVFFRQERWGRGKRPIHVYKFRTMIPNADRTVQATEDDPRITRVGRILRATALDEMPQLLNIWKGEMSFVGPRALPMNERQVQEDDEELSDEQIPGFEERLRLRPGLTGIAQIWAPRDVPRRHKFKYDLFYLKKQSFSFDLKLIVLSFWITFRASWEVRGKKY